MHISKFQERWLARLWCFEALPKLPSLLHCQIFHVRMCSSLNPLWALRLAVAVVADFATWFTWQSAKIEESKARQPKASDHSNSTAMCQASVSFIKPYSCKHHAWKTAIRSASRVSMMYGTWDKLAKESESVSNLSKLETLINKQYAGKSKLKEIAPCMSESDLLLAPHSMWLSPHPARCGW